MLEFIQLLKQRYQAVLRRMENHHPQRPAYQKHIEQLLLAEAFARKGLLLRTHPRTALQIAVIGPTQAGKSSVVNRLLRADMAGVSPLAGYTVHPHGYAHAVNREEYTGIPQYFAKFQALPEERLNREQLASFSLSECPERSPWLPAAVLWDTPDFDSIDALEYQEGLLRAIALADVIVLVVSKEKYADLSVWRVMQAIAGFRQPTLICLNKLSEDCKETLIASLGQKWRDHRVDQPPEIVPLMFKKPPLQQEWPAEYAKALPQLAGKAARGGHAERQRQWLQQHWEAWLAPVYAEHQAEHEWRLLVDACAAEGLRRYQRDYLNHPHHYQTFQQAIIKLLHLLELPVVAKLAAQTRRALTWPIRQLRRLGQEGTPLFGQEEVVLRQAGEQVLLQLADRLWDRQESGGGGFWRDAAAGLRGRREAILQAHEQAVTVYLREFQVDVASAADRLYVKLQEQPLLLNSIRATRAAADTAALMLALQAGGIGVHDLVLAPMMLTATSLIAESAIGGHMARVEAELKARQLAAVQTLFADGLQALLYDAPKHTEAGNRFNIPLAVCRQAEAKLNEKKHGIRFF